MALEDPRATQVGGLCGSIIGVDDKCVYSAVPLSNLGLNATLVVPIIGGTGSQQVEDTAYPGKALKFEQAAGAVLDGAAVANLYLNHTGKALVANNIVLAAAP